MKTPEILAFVLAGGEGARLHPLTAERSKPSVPFGGRYRIVDFVLSNLVNSEIRSIYLLVQYKSQSLIEHIRKAWVLSPILSEQFVTVVPPQMLKGHEWFQGTADAVFQNLNLIQHHDPKLVLVFGADHIYRMDVRQMIAFHRERKADITVAALPVPVDQSSAFGIIATDADGRVREFQEKPEHPSPMPSRPDHAYASMGNYVFSAKVLVEALKEIPRRGENDFARHILPRLIDSHRLYAYDFGSNQVPGVKRYEEKGYWRDVGTLETYFSAHQDILGLTPHFELFNPRWPIYSSNYQGPVSKFDGARIENSIVAAGCLLKKGVHLRNSVIRREVILEEGVDLEDCIIMDYTVIKRGARLRKTIVDRYNVIKAGIRIGYDLEADRRSLHVTSSGVVVVPQSEARKMGHAYFED